jgi:pimeloyl-ACP methyl ester carboxylesterase
MNSGIEEFRLDVSQVALDDLKERLARTRWPEKQTVEGWEQGVPLTDAQALCAYWRDDYDWRRCEARLNALGQYRTTIDGLRIHFLHVQSPEQDALPLILTHGWPGSVIEFLKVIGPLSNPAAHGGDSNHAFNVVVPSLPGYGFSDRPTERGWTAQRIARAWTKLMRRLGYTRFVAQGGDWGSAVTSAMAVARPPELAAIHLNMVVAQPQPEDLANLSSTESAALADTRRFSNEGQGYSAIQRTRPQSIGYALADSPVGQATWIYEKLTEWSDCAGNALSVFSYDEILDNIMFYWLPGTAASSARLYWESHKTFVADPTDLPVACSIFPKEIVRPARRWAERKYPNLIYWGEPEKGGHFAAFEQPEIFAAEIRNAFTSLRGRTRKQRW